MDDSERLFGVCRRWRRWNEYQWDGRKEEKVGNTGRKGKIKIDS